jgi:hypothetical protein
VVLVTLMEVVVVAFVVCPGLDVAFAAIFPAAVVAVVEHKHAVASVPPATLEVAAVRFAVAIA